MLKVNRRSNLPKCRAYQSGLLFFYVIGKNKI